MGCTSGIRATSTTSIAERSNKERGRQRRTQSLQAGAAAAEEEARWKCLQCGSWGYVWCCWWWWSGWVPQHCTHPCPSLKPNNSLPGSPVQKKRSRPTLRKRKKEIKRGNRETVVVILVKISCLFFILYSRNKQN